MDKYKSVSDFLKKKRQRIRKRKAAIIYALAGNKLALDFKLDENSSGSIIPGESGADYDGNYSTNAPMSGLTDHTISLRNEEDLPAGTINTINSENDESKEYNSIGEKVEDFFNSTQDLMFGMPDGVDHGDDPLIVEQNPQQGKTNLPNTLYTDNVKF